ncbi:MAG: hypothetical protein FJ293_03565 [Planctomycetes bacterium]|nr:hypothetical protein [Planctomycetota bacterium]
MPDEVERLLAPQGGGVAGIALAIGAAVDVTGELVGRRQRDLERRGVAGFEALETVPADRQDRTLSTCSLAVRGAIEPEDRHRRQRHATRETASVHHARSASLIRDEPGMQRLPPPTCCTGIRSR